QLIVPPGFAPRQAQQDERGDNRRERAEQEIQSREMQSYACIALVRDRPDQPRVAYRERGQEDHREKREAIDRIARKLTDQVQDSPLLTECPRSGSCAARTPDRKGRLFEWAGR